MYEFLHSRENNQATNRGGDHLVNHLSHQSATISKHHSGHSSGGRAETHHILDSLEVTFCNFFNTIYESACKHRQLRWKLFSHDLQCAYKEFTSIIAQYRTGRINEYCCKSLD